MLVARRLWRFQRVEQRVFSPLHTLRLKNKEQTPVNDAAKTEDDLAWQVESVAIMTVMTDLGFSPPQATGLPVPAVRRSGLKPSHCHFLLVQTVQLQARERFGA
jgi:hypothetical protein